MATGDRALCGRSGNVDRLVVRGEVPTPGIATDSPTIALVDVPGQGPTRVVYLQS